MSDEFGQLLSEQKEVAISQGAVVSGQVIAVKEDIVVGVSGGMTGSED